MPPLFVSINPFLRLCHLVLFGLILGACNPGSDTLQSAQEAEASGKLIEAVDLYTAVLDEHPLSDSAQQADLALQRIYSNYAESLEEHDPLRAINIYDVIINRWPDSQTAQIAETQRSLLKAVENKQEELENADQSACNKASETDTKEAWSSYLTEYPEGICKADAEQFLNRRPMSKDELSTLQSFVSQCQVHQKQCKNYISRYESVIRKNRLDYVNRVLVPYAKREFEKGQLIIERASIYLDGLAKTGVDVETQRSTVLEACTVCTEIQPVDEN